MLHKSAGKLGLLLSVGLAMVLLASTSFAGAAARKPLPRRILLPVPGVQSVPGVPSVTAARGDTIVVTLMSKGWTLWSGTSVVSDQSTTPSVLVKIGGHVMADGTSKTTFRVVGYGSATLQALGRPDCAPSYETACPDWISVWETTVSVPVVDSQTTS